MPNSLNEPKLQEIYYTTQELADIMKLHKTSIQRLFIDEPGVIRIGHSATRKKRQFYTLRIPASVAAAVFERLAVKGNSR